MNNQKLHQLDWHSARLSVYFHLSQARASSSISLWESLQRNAVILAWLMSKRGSRTEPWISETWELSNSMDPTEKQV